LIKGVPVWNLLFDLHRESGFHLDPRVAALGVLTSTPLFHNPPTPNLLAPKKANRWQFVHTALDPATPPIPVETPAQAPAPIVDTFIVTTGAPVVQKLNKNRRKKRVRIISNPEIEDEESPTRSAASPTAAQAKQRPKQKGTRVRKRRNEIQVLHHNSQGELVGDNWGEGGGTSPVESDTRSTHQADDGDATLDEEDFEKVMEECLEEGKRLCGHVDEPVRNSSLKRKSLTDEESPPSKRPRLPVPMVSSRLSQNLTDFSQMNILNHPRIARASASLYRHDPIALRNYISDFVCNIGEHYTKQNHSQDSAFQEEVRVEEGLPHSEEMQEWVDVVENIWY
jgi:hypothetical protein